MASGGWVEPFNENVENCGFSRRLRLRVSQEASQESWIEKIRGYTERLKIIEKSLVAASVPADPSRELQFPNRAIPLF